MRRMILIVTDCIHCRDNTAMIVQRLAGIRIHVKAREVTARNVHTYSVAFLENIRCRVQLDGKRVYPARLHQLLFLFRVTEACPHNTISDVQVKTARPVCT